MSELIHILAAVIVLCVIAYFIQRAPIPAPFVWIVWTIFLLIMLVVLLPFLGVHLPA